MLILSGNNLGERHRDLNIKVNEAANSKLDFDELKSHEEHCDVDKLFKIDLASAYKHFNYILEVLKCGDALYITRALKCVWLYEDKYSEYINTNYLKTNIFPYMSMKLKRKMLTAVSMYLKSGERAIDFYTFCEDEKMVDYACKFLIITPEKYKLKLIETQGILKCLRSFKSIKYFIGISFELANAYFVSQGRSSNILHELRFLYYVSNEKYLNMLERYESCDTRYQYSLGRLGLRVSKDVLKKHLTRVLEYPVLYVNKLNKNMLMKHLTIANIKTLAFSLLPCSSEYFWSINFYRTYHFILQKLPKNELYLFLKNIFSSKYPNVLFEMSKPFYNLSYYEMLTEEERETWALLHIERDEEWPGVENFIWYRFVSFDKAFSGIKRYIYLTTDKAKRSRIINILPETARNQDDLTKILNYFYDRHVNESEEHKVSFINKVIEVHDIYSFETDCWTPLDKLFYSIELYTSESQITTQSSEYWWDEPNLSILNLKLEYRIRSMFYYILHGKKLPELLIEYIDRATYYNINDVINKLSRERNTIVAEYLINYYVEKIKNLTEKYDDTVDDEDKQNEIRDQIDTEVMHVWHVIRSFQRDDNECPEIVLQYMQENMEDYNEVPKFIKKTECDFLRFLKQDVQVAIDGISEIRCNAYRWEFRLCRVFRKLRIYFPNDVGYEYSEFFKEYLQHLPQSRREYRNIKMAVVGIFHLASEDFKVKFMEQYVPENAKIDHMNINNGLLQVQKAICRSAYHSRPPLPISVVLKYIKGDYVQYCLPVFNFYLENSPSIADFIESVLDAPLSIQKHGLRLAFKTYTPEHLKPLILSVWNKTKNISLRMLLYKTLFYRFINDTKEAQNCLYEVLKVYTSELNHDDHDNVYSLLVSPDLPDEFKGDFIEIAWTATNNLTDKTIDLYRRTSVIIHMEKYIHLVQREFPRLQIIDKHVYDMLHMNNIRNRYRDQSVHKLIMAKWNLAAKYIVSYRNRADKLQSLELLQSIISKCLELWNYVDDDIYIARKFINDFIKMIMNKDPQKIEHCGEMISVYQCIYDNLKKTLKNENIYLLAWKLQLSITLREIIHDTLNNSGNESNSARNESFEEVACSFGQAVANLIVSVIEKAEFYRCFYHAIANIISDAINTFCKILDIGNNYLLYFMSESLTNFRLTETHIIALLLLPTYPSDNFKEKHREAIAKIKQLNCSEVNSFLFDKYESDFSVKDFLKQ